MNLLFQNNQFKSSLRSYKPLSQNTKPKKKRKPKKSAIVNNSTEESDKVIDLNDKRFDLNQIPNFAKKAQGGSTSRSARVSKTKARAVTKSCPNPRRGRTKKREKKPSKVKHIAEAFPRMTSTEPRLSTEPRTRRRLCTGSTISVILHFYVEWPFGDRAVGGIFITETCVFLDVGWDLEKSLKTSDTHQPHVDGHSNDPFNLSKSPLKNFIKKVEKSRQVNMYEFIQSRNETPNSNKPNNNFCSVANNVITTDDLQKRSKSELRKKAEKAASGSMTGRSGKERSTKRKNFLELNKKRLAEIKKKQAKASKKIKTKKTHKKSKSYFTNKRPTKESLHIPKHDMLSDIVRVAAKQQHRTRNSELASHTDVYIENESEYDIINELKRDILLKDKANDTSIVSPLNTWGNVTNPFDNSHMDLINGTIFTLEQSG